MHNSEHSRPNLEALQDQLHEIARKITDMDAKGQTGPELDALHKQHQELTDQIENVPNIDELNKAA